MPVSISNPILERVADAIQGTPDRAYTTPIVYPWAVQNFVARPCATRPLPPAEPQRLYVHIPFCNYHCTFCFYAVRTGAKRNEMERYVAALARELEWVPAGTPLSRLTVGGGTPTALPADLLEEVLTAVLERMPPTPGSVHTLEASPDSLTDAHVRVLRERGVGRVSIGIESLDGDVLDSVQRRHTPEQGLAACRKVADAGLALNVDLIYGLPGQTEESFRRDLEAVARTGADTVCLYGLRLNDRTVVAAQLDPGERLDLARVMRWRAFVKQAAEDAGFAQTRCYAFRRADSDAPVWHERPARREMLTFELGVGMSARSQLGRAVYRNHDNADEYVRRVEAGLSPVQSVFDLETDDLKTQFIAGSLANGRPLDRAAYAAAFGASIDHDYGARLERLRGAELVEDDGVRITLTELGKLVYDRLLMGFYSRRAHGWLDSQQGLLHRRG